MSGWGGDNDQSMSGNNNEGSTIHAEDQVLAAAVDELIREQSTLARYRQRTQMQPTVEDSLDEQTNMTMEAMDNLDIAPGGRMPYRDPHNSSYLGPDGVAGPSGPPPDRPLPPLPEPMPLTPSHFTYSAGAFVSETHPNLNHNVYLDRQAHEAGANGDNVPPRFELFLLGEGERKVNEEVDTRIVSSSYFVFKKEDHTLANMLRARLLRHEHVTYAGYQVPHPLVADFQLRVQTNGALTPREAVVQSARAIVADLATLGREFTKEMELKKMADASGAAGEDGAGGAGGAGGPSNPAGEGPSGGPVA
ncbi:MAG: hypothetical protein M4579_006831 [Chaenotheca gracillima]|nr:MAG: hypothetical protein M4579_006831 [Chaenotheca gracillima]